MPIATHASADLLGRPPKVLPEKRRLMLPAATDLDGGVLDSDVVIDEPAWDERMLRLQDVRSDPGGTRCHSNARTLNHHPGAPA